MNMAKIEVKGTSITVVSGDMDDYISLTDIARYKDSDHTDDIIRNWLRNRNTLDRNHPCRRHHLQSRALA
jgi:hypothetical protein